MYENVSILIPFRSDHGHRDELFKWIMKFYERLLPDVEICIGSCTSNLFSRSEAINHAAKQATRDIFLIVDADHIFDPKIIQMCEKELEKHVWIIPYDKENLVSEEITKQILMTNPDWPLDIEITDVTNPIFRPVGGINVIPRKHFETVNGFDERFIGWGCEDDAFALSVNTLCGDFIRINLSVLHLWHPPTKKQSNPHHDANRQLLLKYRKANGDIDKMRKLIDEKTLSF